MFSDEEFDQCKLSDSESMHNYVANAVNVPQLGSQSLPVSEETLKALMDCPKLTTDTFFMAEIPNETSFRLTDDEWKRIEPTYDKPNRLNSTMLDFCDGTPFKRVQRLLHLPI